MWPDYLPSNCPPDQADECNGVVFRLVRSDPPTDKDFRPSITCQNDDKDMDDKCIRCGLSVAKSLSDIQKLKRRARGFQMRKVAEANLCEEHGVIMATGIRGHFTWWPLDVIDYVCLFCVVK